jgi:hypothetical protein
MTKFKDFGSGGNTAEVEPIEFALHGETFECIPEIQGSVLLSIVGSTADGAPAASAALITSFFGKVLTDESAERFDALINSKDRIVSIQTLGEITGWIIEEYTNRPERQPED